MIQKAIWHRRDQHTCAMQLIWISSANARYQWALSSHFRLLFFTFDPRHIPRHCALVFNWNTISAHFISTVGSFSLWLSTISRHSIHLHHDIELIYFDAKISFVHFFFLCAFEMRWTYYDYPFCLTEEDERKTKWKTFRWRNDFHFRSESSTILPNNNNNDINFQWTTEWAVCTAIYYWNICDTNGNNINNEHMEANFLITHILCRSTYCVYEN